MPLEEEAQVEEWRGQQLPVLEQQRHEQASDAAVAVEVRVSGLELHVQEPGAHERRQRVVCVQVPLERAEHLAERLRRWRHVRGVAGAASADPALAATHLAGKLLCAPGAAHKSAPRSPPSWASNVSRSTRVACVPSICDESTASLRTNA
jgi:hypothetical protein